MKYRNMEYLIKKFFIRKKKSLWNLFKNLKKKMIKNNFKLITFDFLGTLVNYKQNVSLSNFITNLKNF